METKTTPSDEPQFDFDVSSILTLHTALTKNINDMSKPVLKRLLGSDRPKVINNMKNCLHYLDVLQKARVNGVTLHTFYEDFDTDTNFSYATNVVKNVLRRHNLKENKINDITRQVYRNMYREEQRETARRVVTIAAKQHTELVSGLNDVYCLVSYGAAVQTYKSTEEKPVKDRRARRLIAYNRFESEPVYAWARLPGRRSSLCHSDLLKFVRQAMFKHGTHTSREAPVFVLSSVVVGDSTFTTSLSSNADPSDFLKLTSFKTLMELLKIDKNVKAGNLLWSKV